MEKFELIKEGATAFYAPPGSGRGAGPVTGPVFFNPVGRIARDAFIACFSAFPEFVGSGGLSFAEAFGGTGIKGIRLAVEGGGYSKFFINDLNDEAVNAVKGSARLNGIEGRVIASRHDVYSFLQSIRDMGGVDALDIDPFGSPVPFIESALRAVRNGGLVSFTATDTAVLSGVHAAASEKKYGIRALRGQGHQETSARALASAVMAGGARLDIATEPLFFHVYKHYVRGYFLARRSATIATSLVKSFGYISYCSCGYTTAEEATTCPQCSRPLKKAGPYYLGPLFDRGFLSKAGAISSKSFPKISLFKMALEDIQLPPYFYHLPFLADEMGVPTPPKGEVIMIMRKMGFLASGSSFDPQGVRTDAPFPLLRAAMGYLSGNPRAQHAVPGQGPGPALT